MQERMPSTSLISFAAPQDRPLLAQWEKHLLPLQRAGYITIWSEQRITPGDRRKEQLTKHLEQADLIVLLLSAEFLADKEFYGLMARALQRSQDGEACVNPLILRPVDWRSSPIGQLACLPTNGRPITRWGDRDEAFHHCVVSLTRLLTHPENSPPISVQSQSPAMALNQPVPSGHHSCFISFSSEDEALAQRLYADLKAQGVKCWFAPHDMKIGARIRPTIDQAIHQQDKLLLLLSQHSIESYWGEDEVEAALERERTERREMLFPIQLDNAVTQPNSPAWAKRLRRQVNIGDFSNWADPQAYEKAFERLLGDLENANQ